MDLTRQINKFEKALPVCMEAPGLIQSVDNTVLRVSPQADWIELVSIGSSELLILSWI